MGCFFACLGTCKHRKSKKSSYPIVSGVQKHEALQFNELIKPEILHFHEPGKPDAKKEKIENPFGPISETKEELEGHLSCHSRKKVTFDLNVRGEEENFLRESEKVGEKKDETPKEETAPSYPSNHRYQNCKDSDSELEDFELQDKEFNEDNYEGEAEIKEESSESLFSLSIESRKQVFEAETDEKEINSPMPKPVVARLSKPNTADRRLNRDSVMNPVENLSQWKAIKARAVSPVSLHAKENIEQDPNRIVPISKEPSFKLLPQPKPLSEGIAVDASLSSWLVGLETTPNSRTSTISVGNSPSEGAKSSNFLGGRPILGELRVEKPKLLSASSPRGSPSRSPSPDEAPVPGTVGSYLSHTGQAMPPGMSSCGRRFSTRGNQIEEELSVEEDGTETLMAPWEKLQFFATFPLMVGEI